MSDKKKPLVTQKVDDEPSTAVGEADPLNPCEPANSDQPDQDLYKLVVVGIGASAGGLEALGDLIANVPTDCMAFIVVQHLAPHHESLLTQLLAKSSKVGAVTAIDGMTLEANHVYVIPPNADLAVMHGVIHLITPVSSAGPRFPIDYLFRSLADDQGVSAIGVVLSGTGTDGTIGLKAIKAAGGITFVQEPSSAKYDGMPRSALASGAADFCLAPKEIGNELSRIAKRPHRQRTSSVAGPIPFGQEQLGKLFVFIRSEFGNDLTHYKLPTVERRIERRMALQKLERFDDYVRYVQSNRDELHALYKDMLITVTSFFRDPEVFEALKTKVFPRLFADRAINAPVRVWVPACATGEEAYSIAMYLLEYCEEKNRDTKIQIFGTDIEEDTIQHARRGVYSANILSNVSPRRINRFFIKKDGAYQVSRRIRDMVIFSKQNILKDPPFSRIDLATCRNLLIYLQPPAQKKVLRILHYALNPSGYLLLGSSETVGDAPDIFSLLDRKAKIYSKKQVAPQAGLDVTFGVPPSLEATQRLPGVRPTLTLQGLADRMVLEYYGPPGVVINDEFEILQFRGHTGPYLDPAPGAATFNILRIARFEFHIELKKVIQQVISQQLRASVDVAYHDQGKSHAVKLDVMPFQDPEKKTRCLLVLFHKLSPALEIPVVSSGEGQSDDTVSPLAQRIQELERELAVTREYLQTTIEDKESANEELKSANEELQSSNEELQSTNEEMETSKEEMQSSNEELTTVNEELQNRMGELSLTNDDLHNVLTGVDNAVVIVGMDLRIRRYTAAAERLFNLVPGDVGRSIGFLDSFLGKGMLEQKVSSTIETLVTEEDELLAKNQRWYALKINLYKTLDHSIRGALISLTDIDVRKRATEMTRDVGAYASRFLAAISHPLLIVDEKLRVVWANEPFLSTFQLTLEESVGSLLPSIGTRQWAEAGLRERLERTFAATVFRDYEMRLRFQDAGDVVVKVGGSQIPITTETPLVLVSIEPLQSVVRGRS